MSRFLKYINYLIGLAAVAIAGAFYWYLYRPLPVTSGSLRAPVDGPARVERDRLGIPHIRAASAADAWFLQGYVTAQDRLFQLDFMRRQGAGELAEVFGPVALESDLETRRHRVRRIAERLRGELNAEERVAFSAYARGVNFFMETNRGRLPAEFRAARYEPAPWSIADSLIVGLHVFRTMTASWRDELLKQAMLASGDSAKVKALFPDRTGGEVQLGSNAWALSGARTASGKPILANDPHLAQSLPGVWHQVHIQFPGFDAAGVSIPGLPAVLIGHNDRIAWGITMLQFDSADLYREQFTAGARVYVHEGKPEAAAVENEIVRIRGARQLTAPIVITRHGPVHVEEAGKAYALRWTAAQLGGFGYPYIELNQARDWTSFRKALSRFPGPSANFVYADVDGNIGYQAAGKLPLRKHVSWNGDVPADGSRAEYDWQGFIPFDDLPSVYNPPSGMLVTANQNPFPPNYPHPVHGHFASHYRSRQIEARLMRRSGWKPEEMSAIQKDAYSAPMHHLARAVAKAAARHTPADELTRRVASLLAEWDGQMLPDSVAAGVMRFVYDHVRTSIVASAAPGKEAQYASQMAPAVVDHIIESRPAGWFADYDQWLAKALADAVDEARRKHGANLDRWKYGRLEQIRLRHPILSEVPVLTSIPFLGARFGVGPAGMEGSGTSVNQITARVWPSMRFIADLADLDNSRLTLPVGESGHPMSSHYKDQWDAYRRGYGLRMEYRRVEPKQVLEVTPLGF